MVSMRPETVEEFNGVVGNFQETDRYKSPLLFGVGGEVRTNAENVLASVRFPLVNGHGENEGSAAIIMKELDISPEGVQNVELTEEKIHRILTYFAPFEGDGKVHKNIDVLKAAQLAAARGKPITASFIFDDIAPQGVHDTTLKLYGLSTRKFEPNTIDLDGAFKALPSVTWQGDTPMDETDVNNALIDAAFGDNNNYAPHAHDKFPLYVHRINAQEMGVRVTDKSKVRLGAYLGEGTTVMPGASYINFNAGTKGAAMIEGRVSSNASVGDGTNVGGGASMLGTLSGGNDTPISTGRNCLLEANSVLGIPIGDAVIISANCAVLAGTPVQINFEGHPKAGEWVKASDLSRLNAVTFRMNSRSGNMEVVRTRRNEEFARKLEDGESILNADLH